MKSPYRQLAVIAEDPFTSRSERLAAYLGRYVSPLGILIGLLLVEIWFVLRLFLEGTE
jgi:hypothetical protein